MILLVGDIGGTKTNLALYEYDGELACIKEKKFVSKLYNSLWDIINEFLKDENKEIKKACFGIAGPVKNGRCYTTNLPWLVDANELASRLKITDVFLLNDLEADAYGLLELSPKEFFELNKGNKRQQGNAALISAGTGLGEAGLFWDKKKYKPFACEGGHTDFAPRDELETELLFYLKNKFGHVSYERIVSGPGICNIYQFLVDTKKTIWHPDFNDSLKIKDLAEAISCKAVNNEDEGCSKAIDIMISVYGAEAGNIALKHFALSGIYLGGGIAPKILEKLKNGIFMKAFIDKGRFSSLVQSIPVRVILNKRTALLGAAYYALRSI